MLHSLGTNIAEQVCRIAGNGAFDRYVFTTLVYRHTAIVTANSCKCYIQRSMYIVANYSWLYSTVSISQNRNITYQLLSKYQLPVILLI